MPYKKNGKYINKSGDGVGQLRRYVLNSSSENMPKAILTNGFTWIVFESKKFYSRCCASGCLNPRRDGTIFEIISSTTPTLNCKVLDELITKLRSLRADCKPPTG